MDVSPVWPDPGVIVFRRPRNKLAEDGAPIDLRCHDTIDQSIKSGAEIPALFRGLMRLADGHLPFGAIVGLRCRTAIPRLSHAAASTGITIGIIGSGWRRRK